MGQEGRHTLCDPASITIQQNLQDLPTIFSNNGTYRGDLIKLAVYVTVPPIHQDKRTTLDSFHEFSQFHYKSCSFVVSAHLICLLPYFQGNVYYCYKNSRAELIKQGIYAPYPYS